MSFNRHTTAATLLHRPFLPVLIVILFAMLGASCQNEQQSGQQETVVTESISPESSMAKDFRVIAGQSAGEFRLGQEVEKSGLSDYFGPANSVDAATCKSWSMWFPQEDQEIDVYAACDSALNMQKSIQLIRLAGIAFISDKELTEKSDVQHVKRLYPAALEEEYRDREGREVVLYDAVDSGIAFEVAENKIRSVILHAPGKKVSDYYLPFLSSPAP